MVCGVILSPESCNAAWVWFRAPWWHPEAKYGKRSPEHGSAFVLALVVP